MMSNLKNRLCALGAALLAGSSLIVSAQVADLPVKVVNGKTYYTYEVQPKETIYSLTRKFKVTSEALYSVNPSLRDGLKAFSTILIPADENVVAATPGAGRVATHKVVRGETVYGISKKYGVTKDQIYEWNPSTLDGLKAGQTIFVSDPRGGSDGQIAPEQSAPSYPAAGHGNPAENPAHPAASDSHATPGAASEAQPGATRNHVVRNGETFYSIARTYGLTIVELEKLNPDVTVVREGDILRIPLQQDDRIASAEQAAPARENPAADPAEETRIGMIEAEPDPTEPAQAVPAAGREINIALLLGMMADRHPQPKQGAHHTEYLKGFLMAVDSMRTAGVPITLSVFDTYNSTDSVRAIIDNPAFREASLVVAPDSEPQLMLLADYGRRNDVYIFNPFVVKDNSYMTNPRMLQANIPQQEMYDKAIDGVITRYSNYLPVFVDRNDAPNDKEAFLSAFKKRLTDAGISYKELTFDNRLSRADLNDLPVDRPLLFIPTSGRQAEANRIFPALIDFHDAGNRMMVFGYPEWTTFKGETLSNMHLLNTVVYSRFYTVADSDASKNFDSRFSYWYGAPMANVLPRQGLLGFDTGMFVVRSLINGNGFAAGPSDTDGIQNGYDFVRPAGASGMINNVLYFVNFLPDGTVDRTRL